MTNKSLFLFVYFIIINKVIDKSMNTEIFFKKQPSININDRILSNYNVDIYISFKIGYKKETLDKIFLKSDTNEFMILKAGSSLYNNKYDPEESSSSKKLVYLKTYNLIYTLKASIYKDTFFFQNAENQELTEFNDLSFLYADSLLIEKYPGIIGLKLVENDIRNVRPFPCQFTDLNHSNNATWMIKFNNDEEGIFYIGDILNEKVFPGYNQEKYRKTNAVVYNIYLSWDLTFSQIKSDNVILNGPMQAFLDFNFGLISCSKEYYYHIKNNFFHEYLQSGKCKEKFYNKNNDNNQIKINSNFTYIVCDKSLKEKNFPELIFSHSTLDYTFKLTYEDVFVTYNDKIYFLIINETEKNERWKFGRIFFKKYNIIFDHNAKTIGIYDDNYSKSKILLIIFEWIIAIFLIMVAIFLAYTLFKRYRLNNYKLFIKREKADEMEDNYGIFGNQKDDKMINMEEAKNEENKKNEN